MTDRENLNASRARFIAGDFGFFTLIQSGERPLRYLLSARFETRPSVPNCECVCSSEDQDCRNHGQSDKLFHSQNLPSDVLVFHDRSPSEFNEPYFSSNRSR